MIRNNKYLCACVRVFRFFFAWKSQTSVILVKIIQTENMHYSSYIINTVFTRFHPHQCSHSGTRTALMLISSGSIGKFRCHALFHSSFLGFGGRLFGEKFPKIASARSFADSNTESLFERSNERTEWRFFFRFYCLLLAKVKRHWSEVSTFH